MFLQGQGHTLVLIYIWLEKSQEIVLVNKLDFATRANFVVVLKTVSNKPVGNDALMKKHTEQTVDISLCLQIETLCIVSIKQPFFNLTLTPTL